MNLHTTLQKFKISETELNAINYFSNFKRTPQIGFYYKMFEKLLSEIEKNFEPHITYSLAKPLKIDSYSYEFWLSKTELLSIRKQKDQNKWNWYVSLGNCSLFTTGIYCQRYGSYHWGEKENLNYEILDNNKKKCKQTFDKSLS